MTDLLLSFFFLTFLEIILGIDNIVVIAIIVNRLPEKYRKTVRFIGLSLSLIFRLVVLAGISLLLRLSKPLFDIGEFSFSGKDLLMIVGGLFLLFKAIPEMYHEIKGHPHKEKKVNVQSEVFKAVVQIIIIDIVFSMDSLITAVGLTSHIGVIASAIIVSIIFMVLFSGFISKVIDKYSTLKMLALSFIVLIGIFLITEGLSMHINKAYIYFAMGFSLAVEFCNILTKRNKASHVPEKIK
ncbi:Membrane protein TerC [Candidatus Hepatincolaceae symbiont of Richtersius coronifer]